MAKAGDVCRLRSGGANMTVERVDGSMVNCVWFDQVDGEWIGPMRGTFDIGDLEFGVMEAV